MTRLSTALKYSWDCRQTMLKNTIEGRCEIIIDKQQVNIYLREKDCFTGYVMHECVHAADFILDNIGAGMGTNPNDSEVRAYLAEYTFCKVGCILGTMKYKPCKLSKKRFISRLKIKG